MEPKDFLSREESWCTRALACKRAVSTQRKKCLTLDLSCRYFLKVWEIVRCFLWKSVTKCQPWKAVEMTLFSLVFTEA